MDLVRGKGVKGSSRVGPRVRAGLGFDVSSRRLLVGRCGEVHMAVGSIGHVTRRAVDGLRVPVDVHELRVGEEAEEQLHTRRVHGRLEHEAAAA